MAIRCMEITCSNFEKYYPTVNEVLNNATFVAIDVEFLGLSNDDAENKFSLFDSIEQRYTKLRTAVAKFPPVQLGLSVFTIDEIQKSCDVDVYNVYLYKRGMQQNEYSFSTSSLRFLNSHAFEFNKVIHEGVSFANLDELHRTIETFKSPNGRGIETFGISLPALLKKLQQTINAKLARVRRKSTGSEGSNINTFEPFSINLGRESLDELQKSALLYKLYTTTPGVKMLVSENMLYCNSSRLTKKQLAHIKEDLIAKITRGLMGASEIVMSIVDKKIPLVGHNSMLDIMYLYQYFVADLPDTYGEFKSAVDSVFPMIVDTKILARETSQELFRYGITRHRLESLAEISERNDVGSNYSCTLRNPIPTSQERYHSAAFDALTTGRVFLKLVELYHKQPEKLSNKIGRTFDTIGGRIPISMMGYSYLSTKSADVSNASSSTIVIDIIDEDPLETFRYVHAVLVNRIGRWSFDVLREEEQYESIRLATLNDTINYRALKILHSIENVVIVSPSEFSCNSSASSSTSSLDTSFHIENTTEGQVEQKIVEEPDTIYENVEPLFKWAFFTGSVMVTAHLLSRWTFP